jgi:hypothetical protein
MLHAASTAHAHAGTAADPYPLQEFVIDSMRRDWDELDPADERWKRKSRVLAEIAAAPHQPHVDVIRAATNP